MFQCSICDWVKERIKKKKENVKLGKTKQTCTSEQIIKNEFSGLHTLEFSALLTQKV